MKTLQVARRFVREEWGGTETVVLETSRRLLDVGVATEIVCSNALARTNSETISGVLVRRFPYFYPYLGLAANAKRKLDKKAGNLFSFGLMKFLQREPRVDLIHLHTGKRLGGIARHIALKRGIPYIVSLHGGCLDVPREEARQWVAPSRGTIEWGKLLGWWVGSRRVLQDAAAIVCVGAGEYEAIRASLPQKRVVLLPNGVDCERFEQGDGAAFRNRFKIPADAKVLLCVGRIDPQKNQLELIRSMPAWKQTHPSVQLVLIGPVTSDEYEARLHDEIRQLGLQQDVLLIPGVDSQGEDLPNAYHAADLFVLPSLHEPFGIVVVEAWASGLPVVASRVGGLKALVSDGHNGLQFDPQTAGDCQSTVLAALGKPQHELDAMASAGRRTAVEQYSWDQITHQLLQLYREVIRDASC